MKLAFLASITVAMETAVTEWGKMASYFDKLLDGTNTLLSPKVHDHLLFDDSTFQRSRLYFWANDALSDFIDRIKNLI